MNQLQQRAVARFGDMITCDEPLAPHTTYRLGGPAMVLARPQTVDQLMALGAFAADEAVRVLVVGRGSNVLVADAGFPGLVVMLDRFVGADDIALGEAPVVVAGGAVPLPVLARRTAAAALTGLEWAVGVPGSVGGAVRMNAGGHGSDIAASLTHAHVVDLSTGYDEWVPVERLGLRFRGSDLGDQQVVLAGRFRVDAGEVTACQAALDEIVHWRREHQPGGQNAGSVFVNPVPGQVAAAQLIDGLGLRGCRRGGAYVSEKHANFIQAGPGASASDVRTLIEHVRAVVNDATGYLLRSEIRLVGFPDDEPSAAGITLGAVR